MKGSLPQKYEFGAFRLEPAKRLLWRDGVPVPLMPKAFEVLLVLVRRHGQTVRKVELLDAVWHDTAVEENNLNVNISALRKVLGEKPQQHHFIVTVPGVGYQFVADVLEVWEDPTQISTSDENSTSERAGHFTPESETDSRLNPTDQRAHAGSTPTQRIRGPRIFLVVMASLFFLVVVIIVSAFYLPSFRSSKAHFQSIKATKLTNSSNAVISAISPDGKYVAYSTKEGEMQELWLRQTAIGSSVRLVPAARVTYFGIVFSNDGNFVYYVIYPKDVGKLYRVPILGGESQEVADNVGTGISFSPDGKQIAFAIANQTEKRDELIIANSDGTERRVLATRRFPGYGWFPMSNPAWSPDGKTIVCLAASEDSNGASTGVIEIDVANGSERSLTNHRWEYATQLAWLSDKSGLLVAGRNHNDYAFQIWHLSYSDGTTRRVTSDVNDYWGVSLSANSGGLVAVRRNQLVNIWTSLVEQPDITTQITSGAAMFSVLSWTPDARLVYQVASYNADIWMMDADGSRPKQLTLNSGQNNAPSVSPDGRYVVFHSNRSGNNQVWRMNIDGSNPKHLVGGSAESLLPEVSPDNKWVFYTHGERSIWKVPFEGGDPIRLTNKTCIWATISPDGKWFACWWYPKESPEPHLALISTEGGQPIKFFQPPSGISIPFFVFPPASRWAADGNALFYIGNRNGVSNIFRQPIEGGEPTQMTHFTSEQIYGIAVSRDGKQIALSRGFESNDVMLLSDSR